MKRPAETTSDLRRSVGLRVAELRELRGSTIAEFAAALGVSDRYVQRVEAGGANLTLESMVKLARALDTRVAELFVTPTKRERPPGRPAGRPEQRRRRRVPTSR